MIEQDEESCQKRATFVHRMDAAEYLKQLGLQSYCSLIVFSCPQCDRWHIATSKEQREQEEKRPRKRCVSDMELHLQMARIFGCSLDELQCVMDLTVIKLEGPGVEVIAITPS